MGGSATVDGGSGMLRALGARFLNCAGAELTDLPAGLAALHTIDLSGLDGRLRGVNVTVLCDVDNPLLGKRGQRMYSVLRTEHPRHRCSSWMACWPTTPK